MALHHSVSSAALTSGHLLEDARKPLDHKM